ncbi:class I SAM-dependent methyltransferase [Streptomyces sp. TG1A-8]|uniref:class I SAM-dependent methyltransferase n=1 Tax=Streptomyces sp. TG1A-8 TaxID=3051385 RepID=UPI00265C1BD6|nr:class I SAM-dependent methyltransferase [Streptomyces sp. TG1A-8]MDO0925013.1 class I SAM-dependent methyltransferase [Streptomyces sp. TG1A-8]
MSGALAPEQVLHLLDYLTWFETPAQDRWCEAAEYIGRRVDHLPAPSAQACHATASAFRPGRLYRAKYDLLTVLHPDDWLAFMNMGYAGTRSPMSDDQAPERRIRSLAAGLYRRAIGEVPMTGAEVLEVGCGRGGGAALVADGYPVRSVTAVDFSLRSVEFCTHVHRRAPVSFVCADACRLPFPDRRFDRVLTVETTHCLTRPQSFWDEARRVLRPGGLVVLADEWPADRVEELDAQVEAAGLRVLERQDITDGVLRSLDQLPRHVDALLSALPEGPVRRMYRRFYRQRVGGDSANLYRSGRFVYLRVLAGRP